MASLRCHGDSDYNKTQIIRNFHLYIIQLWKTFSHIPTHADVVDAQTGEVSTPQKSSRATLNWRGIQVCFFMLPGYLRSEWPDGRPKLEPLNNIKPGNFSLKSFTKRYEYIYI